MPETRNKNGTFAKGQSGNRSGRKGYGFEVRFKKIFADVFDETTIRAACVQLKAHVFGQRVDVKTMTVVDDPDSSPTSRLAAWTKMAEYAFGKPIQPMVVAEDQDGELLEVMKSMAASIKQENDEAKLQGIVDEAMEYLNKAAAQTDAEQ